MTQHRKERRRWRRDSAAGAGDNGVGPVTVEARAGNTVIARNVGVVNHFKSPLGEFDRGERSESKSETLSVKLTASQSELVRRMSASMGISVSELLHDAVELFLAVHPDAYEIIRNAAKIKALIEMIRRPSWP